MEAFLGMEKLREKLQNFVDQAELRVTSTLYGIRVVGNLASHAIYEFSGSDVSRMFDAPSSQISELSQKFALGTTRYRSGFKL